MDDTLLRARDEVKGSAVEILPMPHRGKMNQPGYVKHVAEHIAELRGISVEEVAEATTANFFTLFKNAKA